MGIIAYIQQWLFPEAYQPPKPPREPARPRKRRRRRPKRKKSKKDYPLLSWKPQRGSGQRRRKGGRRGPRKPPPTPAEIRQRAEEVQAGWSERIAWRRAHGNTYEYPEEMTVPVVSTEYLPENGFEPNDY